MTLKVALLLLLMLQWLSLRLRERASPRMAWATIGPGRHAVPPGEQALLVQKALRSRG